MPTELTGGFVAADMVLPMLLAAVISYFLGCSNGAVIISKIGRAHV